MSSLIERINDEVVNKEKSQNTDEENNIPGIKDITKKAVSDPDKQGDIRTVKGAHLVYKRKLPDDTYEEMWIYNSIDSKSDLNTRKAILAGTDIPVNKTHTDDNSQYYELWSSGNAEIIVITGLVN